MELRKVYDSTVDLFDDASKIYQLFNIYFDSESKADFAGNLRQTEDSLDDSFAFSEQEVPIFVEQSNETHYILFNKWLNDIRRISGLPVAKKEEFFKRISDASHTIKTESGKDGIINSYSVKTAFNKIATKVKKMGSVSKMGQITGFEKNFNGYDVSRVLEILDYISIEPFEENVMRIKTNSLLSEEKINPRNSLFLAFIPYRIDLYEMVNRYLKKCVKYNLPYDVELPYDERTKQVLKINSTIDNLGKNLAIIKEIADENPEMIKRMKKPPIFCGSIVNHEWIGIGTYSAKEMERSTFGYTEKRASIAYDVIEKKAKKFIVDNYKKIIAVDDKKVKLKDYIVDRTFDMCFEEVKEITDSYYESMTEAYDTEESERQVKYYFGFRREEIATQKYAKKLHKNLALDMDRMLLERLEEGKEFDVVTLPRPIFGESRTLYMQVLSKVIKEVASKIAINNPSFLSETVVEIQNKLKEQGIDKKTCYEDYVVDRMIQPTKEQEKEKEAEINVKSTNRKSDKEEIR